MKNLNFSEMRKNAREQLRNNDVLLQELEHYKEIISQVPYIDFKELILKMENGENLTFEESFIGFLYVIGATNPIVREKIFGNLGYSKEYLEKLGTIFLMHMRFQEERGIIDENEIAGMVAATRLDYTDLISSNEDKPFFENCGMGGDKGFGENNELEIAYEELGLSVKSGFYHVLYGQELEEYFSFLRDFIKKDKEIKQIYKSKNKKTVNVSTISSLILSSLGQNVMKHGSGANTTAVGSSNYIHELGIPLIFDTVNDMLEQLDINSFVYTDAIVFKSIHDLSGSVIHTETVNHLIGPMTPPIGRDIKLNKVIGINHNVSPEIIAKAYGVLKDKGIYNVGNVVVVGGLKEIIDNYEDEIHQKVAFDELSPFSSILSIIIDGKFVGNFVLSPENIGIKIDLGNILIEGDARKIIDANNSVLKGTGNIDLLKLVAYNSALSFVVSNGDIEKEDFIIDGKINFGYFKDAYGKIFDTLKSGVVKKFISQFSERAKKILDMNIEINTITPSEVSEEILQNLTKITNTGFGIDLNEEKMKNKFLKGDNVFYIKNNGNIIGYAIVKYLNNQPYVLGTAIDIDFQSYGLYQLLTLEIGKSGFLRTQNKLLIRSLEKAGFKVLIGNDAYINLLEKGITQNDFNNFFKNLDKEKYIFTNGIFKGVYGKKLGTSLGVVHLEKDYLDGFDSENGDSILVFYYK